MKDRPAKLGLELVPGARRKPVAVTNLYAYRPYTRALLRRYFRVAVDIGRLPSILGGLCFRARVSSYKLHTFEDAVIFVHDIERVFDRIERHLLEIVAGVILLDYSVPEAALRLGITVQRAERRYAAALDSLSSVLLEVGLLRPVFSPGDEDNPDYSIHPEDALPPRKPPVSVRIDAQASNHRQNSRQKSSSRPKGAGIHRLLPLGLRDLSVLFAIVSISVMIGTAPPFNKGRGVINSSPENSRE